MLLQYLLGQYDAPAFVRRACEVEGAWRQLLEQCRLLRDSLLEMVKLRLGTLHELVGEWDKLVEFVEDASDLDILAQLYEDLKPQLRIPVERTSLRPVWRRTFVEMIESIERFNRRWPGQIETVDLKPINDLRDGYNRYYLIEKECALGSARLARQGFQRLPPVTSADLLRAWPPLPVPRLK